MKIIYTLTISLSLLSCKQYKIDKNCFENGQENNTKHKEFELDKPEDIVKANANHVKFTTDKNIKSYKEDLAEINNSYDYDEKASKKRIEEYDRKFSDLIKNFGQQFQYFNIQKEKNLVYGIGRNQFGYWLLKVEDNIPNAYYLGLSNFTHLNNEQPEKFVTGNKVFAFGSFIRIREEWGYPFGPQMEVVKDQLVFEIDLNTVKKDSDNDRFNDLFEKLVLLNPNSVDTDNDGINDFTDKNPLYKSEKSKFSDLYSQIVDIDYEQFNFSGSHYFFTGYFSDCDYFQKMNPKNIKVLIYPEKEQLNLESDYRLGIFPEYIGKIKKTNDKERFLIDFGSGSGSGFIEAVFENGKWKLKKEQTTAI